VLGLFKLSIVFYIVSCSGSDSILGKELVLNKESVSDLSLNFSSIFFIVEY
jgi:hypothetical protein